MASAKTLGEAWNHGWRIHVRCLDDGRGGLKHKREYGYRSELHLRDAGFYPRPGIIVEIVTKHPDQVGSGCRPADRPPLHQAGDAATAPADLPVQAPTRF